MTDLQETRSEEALATQYATGLLYGALIEAGEPIKVSEVVRAIGREEVDIRLARVILVTHPDLFTATDRKWTIWGRYSDPERSMERNLEEILSRYGLPVSRGALASHLSAIYNRPQEVLEPILERLLSNPQRYFLTRDGKYGLATWLLDTTGESEEDILFDNYLKLRDLERYMASAAQLDPQDLDSVISFLDGLNEPVPNRALQFLLWRAKPDKFNSARLFADLLADGRCSYLNSGEWIGPQVVARLTSLFPEIAQKEVEEFQEAQAVEASQPLVISDAEREQLLDYILNNDSASRASRMLEEIFEVSPGDATYEADLQSVLEVLKQEERIQWLGADRFLPEGLIPEYVFSVPEILRFPEQVYTDEEGNVLDLMLEDDGFDGTLAREIFSPMAMDVLDEDPVLDERASPPMTVRCVLKLHHKEIGTLPLCQLPAGFFPTEPKILQVDLILPNGQKTELWVNNETRLLYGLLDWYNSLPVDSGVVFYLERQAPDLYALTYGEETEPPMFISRNRVTELLELGRRAEEEEMPTFEIVREIMEHYRKGIEFITVLTETNIARRTPRRMVASLLSGYHCFFQRGGAWVYDARKLSQGFDKSKRKYLKKS
jgi:hypothetical protein